MSTPPGRSALVYEKLRRGDDLVRQLQRHGISAALPFGPDSCLLRHEPLTEEAIVELAAGFPAIIGVSGARLTRKVMQALPDLRFISKIGIGYDVIDVDAATDLGILVTNTPSQVEIECVAEHAIALMLAAAKRLDYYSTARMARGGWLDQDVTAIGLRGRTVGLVGFGRIARSVATRLAGWGVQILACDLPGRRVDPHDGVQFVTLADLLTQSDFVSLHLSTPAGARPVLDAAHLALMKPGAVLVNTARGANIDHQALYRALRNGELMTAALDVFDREPPPHDEPLLSLPNVIATPHLGASPPEAETDMELMAADNLAQLFDDKLPATVVNPLARGAASAFRAQQPRIA